MPKISVIIPVYNCEKYLEESLNCITKQNLTDIEIICVDDHSTDSSFEIIKNYAQKDNRIIVLTNNEKGAGSARNIGLKKATGEYLLFLDSDDYYSSNLCLDSYLYAKATNADMVFWDYKLHDCSTNMTKSIVQTKTLKEYVNYSSQHEEFNFLISAPHPWSKLIKRSFVIKNNLEFQNIPSCNDIAFTWKCMALSGASYYLAKELVTYRVQTGTSISAKRYEKAGNIIKAAENIKSTIVNLNSDLILDNFYKSIMNNFMYEFCQFPENIPTDEYEKKVIDFLPEYYKKEMENHFRNKTFPARYRKLNKKYYQRVLNVIQTNEEPFVFWGASLFLEKFLQENKIKNENILGIIDKNPSRCGEKLCGLEIFSPVNLNNLKVKKVLFTIQNNNEIIYKNVQDYLKENHSNINLLTNIFAEENFIDKNNKIYLLNQNGERKEVNSISGLNIIFKGENSIVEIEDFPLPKFNKCNLKCGSNCYIKFSNSRYIIYDLNMIITAYGSIFTVGKDFSCNNAEIVLHDEPNLEIHIGNDCMFAHNIMLRSSDGHTVYDIETKEILNKPEKVSITIGNHVWVGHGATILKNSKVSDNTVIAKSTLVNKKFEETNIILAGQPAKIVRKNINWDRKHTYAFEEEINNA